MSTELTPRQQAVKIIEADGSVVVNTKEGRKQFTKTNLHELPPEEDFVTGDSAAQTETLETLKVQEKAIQERIKALETQLKEAKKEETPAEAPKKEEAPVEEEDTKTEKKNK